MATKRAAPKEQVISRTDRSFEIGAWNYDKLAERSAELGFYYPTMRSDEMRSEILWHEYDKEKS